VPLLLPSYYLAVVAAAAAAVFAAAVFAAAVSSTLKTTASFCVAYLAEDQYRLRHRYLRFLLHSSVAASLL
jgi:hypothetical protein